MILWTFITVTYNNAVTLKEFWGGEIPEWAEWIVVDNASQDNTSQIAEQLGASRVITLESNVGFGSANNVGLRAAQGLFIAFANPDVTVNFESMKVLAQAIDRTGGIVGPQLVNPDGSLQPNGRGLPTLASKVRNRLPHKFGIPGYQLFAHKGQLIRVDWLIGAAVLGRKETFDAIGGWDERFFLYYEDSDIGLRAWLSGLSVELVGDANWIHGWARETTQFRLDPWKREIASMAKFYSRYPSLLGPVRFAKHRLAKKIDAGAKRRTPSNLKATK